MIEQYQRDWAKSAGVDLKEYSEGGYRTVLAHRPGGDWYEPDWEFIYLDMKESAPAREARSQLQAAKRKDKRAKRAPRSAASSRTVHKSSSSRAPGYCSICKGPHVYKHGRA